MARGPVSVTGARGRSWAFTVTAVLLLALFSARPAEATTFTVVNTNDSGPGSLRQAILSANASSTTDTIGFAIPGSGPHTITPATGLPEITVPVIIDGYTQPGASENTEEVGTNAVLRVELDGSQIQIGDTAGLRLSAPSSVRGLVINRFYKGILVTAGGSGSRITGNFVGTNPAGDAARDNENGVELYEASNVVIGGTTPAARNLISGNNEYPLYFGIYIWFIQGGATANVVQGNLIGTDASGEQALPNANGVWVQGDGNVVGGTEPGAGNVISGNEEWGMDIRGSDHRVQGNLIGTNAAGTAAVANGIVGLSVQASGTLIGGTEPGAGNVISGNGDHPVRYGLSVAGTGNVVQGNRIGTDRSGSVAIPNSNGLRIVNADSNLIGGTAPGAGNVISGNDGRAVTISSSTSSPATGNVLRGNTIGSDPAGAAVPNGDAGIVIEAPSGSATGNSVGGTVPGAGNVIAGNGGPGVLISGEGAVANPVVGNSIFGNEGLGIDLDGGDQDGFNVTANDPQDADDGPNNLQNHPLLTGAEATVADTTVTGTLHSLTGTSFRVEVFSSSTCDPSGHGQGRTYLGFVDVTTDSSGDAAFTATVGPTPSGVLTATATRVAPGALTDTSEFSPCLPIERAEPCPPDTVPPSGFADVAGNSHRANIDCVAYHGIAQGLTADLYGPAQVVTRGQMASFIARTLEAAGHTFPPANDQGFTDIAGSTHADRVNQLAQAGIVQGVTATSYAPGQPVRRDQMASFLVRAVEHVAGALPAPPAGFSDTAGNTHETNIDKAAAANFTLGATPTTYQPGADVRRDQMASFISRALNHVVTGG